MSTGRTAKGTLLLAAAGAATAILALAGPASATVASTSASETYGPGGDFVTYCLGALPFGAGGGCFTPAPGASSVQASLQDDVSSNTAGEIQFRDAANNSLGPAVGFCGASAQVPIPAGTAEIFVVADGPLLATLAEGCGPGSTATAGTATLTQFFPTTA